MMDNLNQDPNSGVSQHNDQHQLQFSHNPSLSNTHQHNSADPQQQQQQQLHQLAQLPTQTNELHPQHQLPQMQQQQQQIQNQFEQQLFQPNHQEHQLPSQQIPLLNSQAQTQAQPQPQLMLRVPSQNPPAIMQSSPDPLVVTNGATALSESLSMNRKHNDNLSDTGKTCRFCKKQFSQRGSLIRHLDLKKGDLLHPSNEVTIIRNQNRRRNSSVDVNFSSIEKSESQSGGNTPLMTSESFNGTNTNSKLGKKRRVLKKSLAISQISCDSASGQREKSKLRRKLRDRRIKAKLLTNDWFQDLFAQKPLPKFDNLDGNGNNNSLITAEIFCQLVALYLPINDWPVKIPDETCLTPTIERMRVRETHNLINLLNKSFLVYQKLTTVQKKQLWINESQRILQASIGSFSLCDLHNIKGVIAKREQANFEEICRNDKLSAFVEVENSPNHHGGVLGVDDEREADIEEEVDEDDDDEVNSTQVEKVKLITPQKRKTQSILGQVQLNTQQNPANLHNSSRIHGEPYIQKIPEVQHNNFEDFGTYFDKFY